MTARHARVICGDALAVLRTLPTAGVHCVVTSPPYWGLRDYGVLPLVWGGASTCEHEWGRALQRHKGGPHGEAGALAGGQRSVVEAQASTKDVDSGTFCSLCSAWRGSLGLEPTPQLFVEHLVEVFEEVRRVLRPDGTLWLNMGDCYATGAGNVGARPGGGIQGDAWAGGKGPITSPNRMPQEGLKPKDLVGMPWRIAFALQAAGWWLRSEVIWNKPNPMPESVTDRPTKSHEQVFLLAKSERYFYDAVAVREADAGADHPRNVLHRPEPSGGLTAPLAGIRRAAGRNGTGRNLRSVWTIATSPFPEAHFATFPPELAERCIRAGTSEHGCCAACGAPWRRIVDREFIPQEDVAVEKGVRAAGEQKPMDASNGWAGIPHGTTTTTTTGWAPTCECEAAHSAPAVPCTVLDLFGGAGTTAMVTLRLGRAAVSIELKPEYVEMQERRIRDDAPLFNRVEVIV